MSRVPCGCLFPVYPDWGKATPGAGNQSLPKNLVFINTPVFFQEF